MVALESTIFSELGLPEPANRECLVRVEETVRSGGAVPAMCGVLDGRAVVGADRDEAERLFGGSGKVGACAFRTRRPRRGRVGAARIR